MIIILPTNCSGEKNLTFNTKLRFLPQYLVKYVLFHEFVHLLERKYNDRSWTSSENTFPNCEEKEEELLAYWFFIANQHLKS